MPDLSAKDGSSVGEKDCFTGEEMGVGRF